MLARFELELSEQKPSTRHPVNRNPLFSFFKKWPTQASFCLFSFFSNTIFYRKNCRLSMIRTRIVGVVGEQADHLTTTTALGSLSLTNARGLIERYKY